MRGALLKGQPLAQWPEDLYIPPEALEVFLEIFEGPLDLLLYLIRRHNLDICDIPIAEITRQYMAYVEGMKALKIELAAEYLAMAAWLSEMKSRMLLPSDPEEEEEDPRAELVRQLQEYERFKAASEALDALPRIGRDIFPTEVEVPSLPPPPLPSFDIEALCLAFQEIMARAALFKRHTVKAETLSVRERMVQVLDRLREEAFTEFTSLFSLEEGRQGVVVTFLALLELARAALVEIVQNVPLSPIHVRPLKEHP